MQAVILAAGEGTRLRPLTRSRPKAMIPVANRPVIEYVIKALNSNGIRDIVVVAGYRKEHMLRYLNHLEVPVTVVVQEKQLGTAHALKCAEPEIDGDFLLLPGDNYIDAASIARIKGECNAVLVKEHPNPSNFGVAVIQDGYLSSITEKPEDADVFTVSTGIYSFTKEIFGYIDSCDLPDAVSAMIRDGGKIKAVDALDWQDAIYPWDLLKLNRRLLEQIPATRGGSISRSATVVGEVHIGSGTVIGPHTTIYGPVCIGDDCEIAPHSVIMPGTSIGSRVSIEPFTYVKNSIIMDDSGIGSHSRITDTVMAEGCVLGDHTTTAVGEDLFEIEGRVLKAGFGAILGDRVTSAPFTVFKNCLVGNNVTVGSGRVVPHMVGDDAVVI